jgi:hypothetical protein
MAQRKARKAGSCSWSIPPFDWMLRAKRAAAMRTRLMELGNPMLRRLSFALASLLVAVPAASAGWHEFWHGVEVDYHRNNCWPHPFREMSAASVQSPFSVMIDNGWRSHNTFTSDLFRDGDNALTTAGQSRLHWISTQAPGDRRTVFILRGDSQELTDARIASVQQSLSAMGLDGSAQVVITDVEPPVGNGQILTLVNKARLQSMPAPVLRQSGGLNGNSTNSN